MKVFRKYLSNKESVCVGGGEDKTTMKYSSLNIIKKVKFIKQKKKKKMLQIKYFDLVSMRQA